MSDIFVNKKEIVTKDDLLVTTSIIKNVNFRNITYGSNGNDFYLIPNRNDRLLAFPINVSKIDKVTINVSPLTNKKLIWSYFLLTTDKEHVPNSIVAYPDWLPLKPTSIDIPKNANYLGISIGTNNGNILVKDMNKEISVQATAKINVIDELKSHLGG